MKKAVKWIVIGLSALLAAIVLAACIVLSPGVLTGLAVRLANNYVDGEVQAGKVRLSLLKDFPCAHISMEDLLVTYPHSVQALPDCLPSHLCLLGNGESTDTLASFERAGAGIDLKALLKDGKIRVNKVSVQGLEAFLHRTDSTCANWEIIRIPESSGNSSKSLSVEVNDINVSDIRRLAFTDIPGGTFVAAGFSGFSLQGGLWLEDGLISGLAELAMDGDIDFQGPSVGRIMEPFGLEVKAEAAHYPDSLTDIGIERLKAYLSCLPIECEGSVKLATDSTFVKLHAEVEECPIGELADKYGRRFTSLLEGFETDACLSLTADAEGWYKPETGSIPSFEASLKVPDSRVAYESLVEDGRFDLALKASNLDGGRLHADLEDLCFSFAGAELNASGSAEDLLGKDPSFDIKAFACTQFAVLSSYLPKSLGINADGDVDLELEGKARMSQLNLRNLHRSSLRGRLFSDALRLSMPSDTLYAYVSRPDIRVRTSGGVQLETLIDSVRFVSGAATYIMGSDVGLSAMNEGSLVDSNGSLRQLEADLSMGSFNMRGTDSLSLGIRNSTNHISYLMQTEGDSPLPEISLTSGNRLAFLRTGAHRISLANADISGRFVKRGIPSGRSRPPRSSTRRPPPDSTSHRFMLPPPPDSADGPERSLPDFLKELDFRKSDIHINVGESISKLYREWNPEASIKVARGTVVTPLLPLRNNFSSLSAGFDEDKLEISGLNINSGESQLSLKGRLQGLRPVLSGAGQDPEPMNLIVNADSRMLNANELIAAIDAGTHLVVNTSLDDADYAESLTMEGLGDSEEELDYSLIVVPANLNANITINVDSIRYSKLAVGDFSSRLRMRERCVQITRTSAVSPLGNLGFEGFYSTVSKEDLSTGFNLKLDGITADRIIELMPAVDSLVPMLKSFKGKLDCELAATSQLDTNMNLVIPTINGAVKIQGSGLELSDTGDLRRIAQILMFKDSRVGHIDDMSVSGIIANNQLEIYPFILGVDRYTLGLSGLQGFDQNFKYHISVIKSPLPFKFGINLKGNFDKWTYSIGKARYKSEKIPLFSPEVDTLQVNLVASIKDIFRKGVDNALREYSEDRQKIDSRREEFDLYDGRDEEAEGEDDDLSVNEMQQIDDYLLDLECEAESLIIEQEIDEMFDDEFFESMIEELLGEM